MTAAFPSGSNTFVQSFEASGKLISGFSRNIADFPINTWCKQIPVKKTAGYYLRITAENAARIVNTNLSDFIWPDGHEAQIGNDNAESFEFKQYSTIRYAYPFNLGDLAVQQADWPILAIHAAMAGQQAMTARTVSVGAFLTTAGNWEGYTSTATATVGGLWDVSGASDKFILKSFNYVDRKIGQNTIGVVKRKDIICLVNPDTAHQMAETEEFRDMLKQSQFALGQVRGDIASQNGRWMMPDMVYGMNFLVDDTWRITSRKGASAVAGTYAIPNNVAIFCSRPGGLVGMEGIPDFSTFQLFMQEEMTVETKHDPDNRRSKGRVVENFDVKMVSPASGWYLTAVTS